MIEITITRSVNGSVEKLRSYSFSNSASFKTEILTTIFKAPEFSCGTIVWLDSGCRVRRQLSKDIVRPLMCPIKIKNSGFSEEDANCIIGLMCRKAITLVNSLGEVFEMSYSENNALSPSDMVSTVDKIDDNQPSDIRVNPVSIPVNSDKNKSIFTVVDGYVPKSVSKRCV